MNPDPTMPSISIIMPVYNTAPYLRECIDSILAQTVEDWELLCVDDGSSDESATILGEYASRDSRIRVFPHEHSNAGAARNVALGHATGEYLAFLDSDDVFSPWLFETLLDKAQLSDADVVTCKAKWFRDGQKTPSFKEPTLWTDCTPDPDWSKKPISSGTMPWNKLIRRSFVEREGLRFLEQSSTNDLTFIGLALALSRKTLSTEIPLVAYRQRTHSIQAEKSRNPLNSLTALTAFLDGLKERGYWEKLSLDGQKKWFRCYVGHAMFELRSQTTFKGYRTLYRGLVDADHALGLSATFPPDPKSDNVHIVRYREIVAGKTRERIRAFFAALFAPMTGNRKRTTRSRPLLLRLVNGLSVLLFPWRHIKIHVSIK